MCSNISEIDRSVKLLRSGKNASRNSSKAVSRALVLLYHHVGPSRPGIEYTITLSPERFERQMKWLRRRGYATITPFNWLRCIRGDMVLPRKPVLVTFDDAYADIAEYALPILRKYGLSGTVFVVTKRLGETNTWDEALGRETLKLMTAEQIQYWAEQGIEFGAHSRTHADLTQLSSTECAREITGSRNDLAALLGSPVVSFAYPYGKFNDAVYEVVRKEFDLAFTAQQGVNDLRVDPHLLRRTLVCANDSQLRFALLVRSGLNVGGWRARLGVRTRVKQFLSGLREAVSKR